MSAWLVGGYTADMGGTADGIAVLVSAADGSLEHAGYAASALSPSYLLASGDLVFAASEGAARVEAFRRDGTTLTHIGGDDAGGIYPCHLARFGDTVIASCYGDGTLGMLNAEPVKLTAMLGGEGSGPRTEQEGPHAHSTLSLDGRIVFSADLGADRINVHVLHDGVVSRTGSVELAPGTGPRDFRVHPSGYVFLLGELSCEVLVLSIDGDAITLVGSTPVPGAVEGDHAAELSLSDDGRFAFVGLRGSNLIATLAVSEDGSTLRGVTATDCGGDWPRHHAVDGDMLHVANQRSSTVASFRIRGDGTLVPVGKAIPVASPTFLLRLPA